MSRRFGPTDDGVCRRRGMRASNDADVELVKNPTKRMVLDVNNLPIIEPPADYKIDQESFMTIFANEIVFDFKPFFLAVFAKQHPSLYAEHPHDNYWNGQMDLIMTVGMCNCDRPTLIFYYWITQYAIHVRAMSYAALTADNKYTGEVESSGAYHEEVMNKYNALIGPLFRTPSEQAEFEDRTNSWRFSPVFGLGKLYNILPVTRNRTPEELEEWCLNEWDYWLHRFLPSTVGRPGYLGRVQGFFSSITALWGPRNATLDGNESEFYRAYKTSMYYEFKDNILLANAQWFNNLSYYVAIGYFGIDPIKLFQDGFEPDLTVYGYPVTSVGWLRFQSIFFALSCVGQVLGQFSNKRVYRMTTSRRRKEISNWVKEFAASNDKSWVGWEKSWLGSTERKFGPELLKWDPKNPYAIDSVTAEMSRYYGSQLPIFFGPTNTSAFQIDMPLRHYLSGEYHSHRLGYSLCGKIFTIKDSDEKDDIGIMAHVYDCAPSIECEFYRYPELDDVMYEKFTGKKPQDGIRREGEGVWWSMKCNGVKLDLTLYSDVYAIRGGKEPHKGRFSPDLRPERIMTPVRSDTPYTMEVWFQKETVLEQTDEKGKIINGARFTRLRNKWNDEWLVPNLSNRKSSITKLFGKNASSQTEKDLRLNILYIHSAHFMHELMLNGNYDHIHVIISQPSLISGGKAIMSSVELQWNWRMVRGVQSRQLFDYYFVQTTQKIQCDYLKIASKAIVMQLLEAAGQIAAIPFVWNRLIPQWVSRINMANPTFNTIDDWKTHLSLDTTKKLLCRRDIFNHTELSKYVTASVVKEFIDTEKFREGWEAWRNNPPHVWAEFILQHESSRQINTDEFCNEFVMHSCQTMASVFTNQESADFNKYYFDFLKYQMKVTETELNDPRLHHGLWTYKEVFFMNIVEGVRTDQSYHVIVPTELHALSTSADPLAASNKWFNWILVQIGSWDFPKAYFNKIVESAVKEDQVISNWHELFGLTFKWCVTVGVHSSVAIRLMPRCSAPEAWMVAYNYITTNQLFRPYDFRVRVEHHTKWRTPYYSDPTFLLSLIGSAIVISAGFHTVQSFRGSGTAELMTHINSASRYTDALQAEMSIMLHTLLSHASGMLEVVIIGLQDIIKTAAVGTVRFWKWIFSGIMQYIFSKVRDNKPRTIYGWLQFAGSTYFFNRFFGVKEAMTILTAIAWQVLCGFMKGAKGLGTGVMNLVLSGGKRTWVLSGATEVLDVGYSVVKQMSGVEVNLAHKTLGGLVRLEQTMVPWHKYKLDPEKEQLLHSKAELSTPHGRRNMQKRIHEFVGRQTEMAKGENAYGDGGFHLQADTLRRILQADIPVPGIADFFNDDDDDSEDDEVDDSNDDEVDDSNDDEDSDKELSNDDDEDESKAEGQVITPRARRLASRMINIELTEAAKRDLKVGVTVRKKKGDMVDNVGNYTLDDIRYGIRQGNMREQRWEFDLKSLDRSEVKWAKRRLLNITSFKIMQQRWRRLYERKIPPDKEREEADAILIQHMEEMHNDQPPSTMVKGRMQLVLERRQGAGRLRVRSKSPGKSRAAKPAWARGVN